MFSKLARLESLATLADASIPQHMSSLPQCMSFKSQLGLKSLLSFDRLFKL